MTPSIIVALDFDSELPALRFVESVDSRLCRLKIGKQLFTRTGPAFVKRLVAMGFDVFLDLKFHDIPNTVANACLAAADLGVWMVNVHAAGGPKMLEAAYEAYAKLTWEVPSLIGVTALTSMDAQQLSAIGISDSPAVYVNKMAKLCDDCGLDGVVCSAQEAESLREAHGPRFQLVTPGIRPKGSESNDQVRVVTPAEALSAGVTHMVIGRPITQSTHPKATLQDIIASVQ